ncbi:uncharacterized protein [Eucyclogobius newberryi]|uniref:uncharacterized protein n=1 Tax=Eucyclogobius newberryi TaxID=166745 RepID=UPI003B5CDC2A
MNLYRSFGNLMEAWVSEAAQEPDWLERNEDDPPSPPSDADTNVCSESVDSGVETASSDISFPTASMSVDLDPFTPPPSQCPVLSFPAISSSSTPSLMSNRSIVEQALLRVESFREKRKVGSVDEVVMRRPLSSLFPQRHTSDLARGQRSGSFVLRKTSNSSLLVRHTSEAQRRPQSAIYDRQTFDCIPKVLTGAERSELSPGLQYLEQVCQMLEEYAREQLHHNTPPTETIEESDDKQAAGTCHFEPVDEKEGLEKTRAEASPSLSQQKRERRYGHFRQRSASDTNLASLHLRRLKLDYEECRLSSHDLQETAEEDQENQECQEDGLNKSKNYWRFKFGSMRRDEKKSPQMLPLDRSSTRRRLSQFFRKRRKTGPI